MYKNKRVSNSSSSDNKGFCFQIHQIVDRLKLQIITFNNFNTEQY